MVADEVVDVDHLPAGVPVRTYRPRRRSARRVVLNVHGGGWCLGSVDAEDQWCATLAEQAGTLVVSVDYRLAPEHPFPAGLTDVVAALDWTMSRARTEAGPDAPVAVMGNSSGANLAAAACLWARDHQRATPTAMILWYPALDDALGSPSAEEFRSGVGFNTGSIERLWQLYLQGTSPTQYAAPARAPSLVGLPKALVLTAENDPLRDEGETFARRLYRSGVPVNLHRYGGMPHGFIAHADRLEAARNAQERTFAFVRGL